MIFYDFLDYYMIFRIYMYIHVHTCVYILESLKKAVQKMCREMWGPILGDVGSDSPRALSAKSVAVAYLTHVPLEMLFRCLSAGALGYLFCAVFPIFPSRRLGVTHLVK